MRICAKVTLLTDANQPIAQIGAKNNVAANRIVARDITERIDIHSSPDARGWRLALRWHLRHGKRLTTR
jgi:hypothetical protein